MSKKRSVRKGQPAGKPKRKKKRKLVGKEELARLLATTGNPHEVEDPVVVYPKGVEPSVKLDGGKGVVTQVVPAGEDPCWDTYLKEAGFGDQIDVLSVTQVRAWQQRCRGEDPIWLRYLRAEVAVRRHADTQRDIDELTARIARHQPKRPKKPRKGLEIALVVTPADLQTGKRDGEGTEAVVTAMLLLADKIIARIAQLAAMGYRVTRLYLVGMGDLVESCTGAYAMQTFSIELYRREQVKVVRHLFLELLKSLAPEVHEIVVATVGGNHGEHRRDGKAFTWWGDNDDVAAIEQVGEILSENKKAYGHISFVIPRDELTACLDVLGTPVAFCHGHQWKGSEVQHALKWWKNARFHDHAIAGAKVLVAAHRHHFLAKVSGSRTFLQCPPVETESTWWKEQGGGVSPQGVLSFACGPHWPLGWGALEIL